MRLVMAVMMVVMFLSVMLVLMLVELQLVRSLGCTGRLSKGHRPKRCEQSCDK